MLEGTTVCAWVVHDKTDDTVFWWTASDDMETAVEEWDLNMETMFDNDPDLEVVFLESKAVIL